MNITECSRVAWAIGKKNAIGSLSENAGCRSAGIDEFDFEARLPKRAENIVFDSEVVGDDAILDLGELNIVRLLIGGHTRNRPKAGLAFPDVVFLGGNLFDEI